MISSEKSMILIEKQNIFSKIHSLLKKVFCKTENNVEFFSVNMNENSNHSGDNSFMQNNGFESNNNSKLLWIQENIEKYGITRENVIELTKDLNEDEMKSLIILYERQINAYNSISENCRKKIIKIKKTSS